jgi:hypothetical protein
VLGGLNALFDRTNPLFFGGLELRHVGRGTSHWDFGLLAGGATAEGDGVGFAGVRIGHVWEGVGHGLEWTISPVILFGGGAVAIPGAWSSLRWELPI